jgi:hypothetical protein
MCPWRHIQDTLPAPVAESALQQVRVRRSHAVLARTDSPCRNLSALWANFAALGHTRLLDTGVFTTLSCELAWISDAVPNADITSIRLIADLLTLKARIYRREIGSGARDQLRRTIRQLDQMRQSDPTGTEVIDTSDQPVSDTATRIVNAWLGKPIARP